MARTAGSARHTRDAEFTEYVASRSEWLRKVAYLLCSDWHRADDLVQESVTKLYANWSRVGQAENRDGYARTVRARSDRAAETGVRPVPGGTGRTSWCGRPTGVGAGRGQ